MDNSLDLFRVTRFSNPLPKMIFQLLVTKFLGYFIMIWLVLCLVGVGSVEIFTKLLLLYFMRNSPPSVDHWHEDEMKTEKEERAEKENAVSSVVHKVDAR